jgi:hypothetical protein
MEMRAKQVIYGMAEIIAAHQLLRYVRKNNDEEKLRMAAGAGMAGLGFVFGPELHSRLQRHDFSLSEQVKQHLLYASGGAILGGMVGYKLGPKLNVPEIQEAIDNAKEQSITDPQRPGGLITIASAGWLGYSLFFDGKTPDEQRQHLWGLGAGVVGYAYGPEIFRKIKSMSIPASSHDDALEIYARGSTLVGSIAGGLLGWYKGSDIVERLKK